MIVDDEPSMLEFLNLLFQGQDHQVTTAASVADARAHLAAEAAFDLVLCDILMPDGNGLELLKEIKAADAQTEVIMMTAYASNKSAVEAMRLGAYNYISKPFDNEELKVLAIKALERKNLGRENTYLKNELAQRYRFTNIIGRSARMQEIFSLIERVAKTHSTVLVRGESGTGKELIARAIHQNSPRVDARFLSINCGALPEPLLESELFGHEKGAFTGAVRQKKGLFQEADGGTLFLDEIGEMTTSMQVKLLRALQERRVRRVGSAQEEPIDVRIIAATNRNLQDQISQGAFREDLFYRINVIPIHLPPLRERREDIPALAEHFLAKYSAEMGLDARTLTTEGTRLLCDYDWPGNVRELENCIERAIALSTESSLTVRDLPIHISRQHQPNRERLDVALPDDGMDLEAYLDQIRIQLMSQALTRTDGVQTQAAELLGMTFRSFRYYAKKLNIPTGA
ncbi:MAG: sigma-54 dependent transcriptional regulator [Acidobacteriota bacterium]